MNVSWLQVEVETELEWWSSEGSRSLDETTGERSGSMLVVFAVLAQVRVVV